jgi:hypothetical protein
MVDQNPGYTETAILSVYNFILDDLKRRGVDDPQKFLEDSKINFIFTENFMGNFTEGFTKLNATSTLIFDHPEVYSFLPFGFQRIKNIEVPAQNVIAMIIPVHQLATHNHIQNKNSPNQGAFLGGFNLREKIFRPEHF